MNAQAIVEHENAQLPSVDVADLTPMQMAYHLAAQGVDPATVREMLSFGRELEREAAEKAFGKAMAAAQGEMTTIVTNAVNPQTRSRYADYAQLDRALRPIYKRHGFSLSFNDGETDKPDWVRIECFVSHTDGHTRTYHKDMPADGKGAKGNDVMTKTHAVGAAQSYAMRYLLRMIFNVAVGDGDVDGNVQGDTVSEEQVEELKALIDTAVEARPGTSHADWLTTFLDYMKAPTLNSIPAKDFAKAKSTIQSAIKQGAR
jgi:hypothetical protein